MDQAKLASSNSDTIKNEALDTGFKLWSFPGLCTGLVLTIGLTCAFPSQHPLFACLGFSFQAYLFTEYLIPLSIPSFFKANITGRDLLKVSKPTLPESLGLIPAVIYLITIYLFMPFPFAYSASKHTSFLQEGTLPHIKFNQFLSGLLSIQAMTILGFTDDVFDVRWRYKVLLPAIASIPLLIVYYISGGITCVVVPYPLDRYIHTPLELGLLYYIYMGMVAIFCTHTINIYAGSNGVEVGQTVILSISLILFNIFHLQDPFPGIVEKHFLSLYLLVPLLAVSLPLLRKNWYPAQVFVGDTFCYFSGMVFAVVGILGHFSKTLLLFFGPQIFNFIFSTPQLFKLVPCPRHRMPKLDPETGLLEASRADLTVSSLNSFQLSIILFAEKLRLISVKREAEPSTAHGLHSMTNFTLISLILVKFGPLKENHLAIYVMVIQALWSFIAVLIRYKLVHLFYNA